MKLGLCRWKLVCTYWCTCIPQKGPPVEKGLQKCLVATAVCISCCQEQSPRRKHTHCSVYRGFLQSPGLFPLLSLIVQSIVKVASADYLSRHLIENTLISIDVFSICTLFRIFLSPLWH